MSTTACGPQVSDFTTLAELKLDPQQVGILDEICSLDAEGKWVFERYSVPGGQGEDILEARALAGLFLFGERILWVADRQVDARESFRRIAHVISTSPPLYRLVKFRHAYGGERIDVRGGGHLGFVRPRGARGATADTLLIDGWLSGYDEMCVFPALATAPNPQSVRRIT